MRKILVSTLFFISGLIHALQAQSFSKADSLRGALRLERTCYDVTYYDLKLQFNLFNRSIQGSNTIYAIKKKNRSIYKLIYFRN